MTENNYTTVKKGIRISLAFTCAIHLSLNTALCGQFDLDDFNKANYRIHYNNLPSVEESDALLKDSPYFNPFLKKAEEIVTRYGLESAVGLRLIHRHFTLDDNQVMAERYEIVDEVPSLITSAHKFEEAEKKGVVPASWIFSDSSEEILLFEASNDSAVKASNLKLQQSPEFFDEMGKNITDYNFNGLISLALLRRDALVAQDDQIYMEINSEKSNQSIVQLWDANKTQQSIQTSWSFKGARQQKCWPIMKCVWVPDYPEGKHRYLRVDHTYTRDPV